MPRQLRQSLDRSLAMLVALAVAWFPANLRTSCGCESCECQQPAGESCCCESAAVSVCDAEALQRACCESARSADRCRCEVRRSEVPAASLVRGNQTGSTDSGTAGPIVYPIRPQPDTSLAFNTAEFIRPGPSLRILYCVWRN